MSIENKINHNLSKKKKIHPSTDGHLGGFQFLAFMNKVASNILVCVFMHKCIYIFHLRKYPGVKLFCYGA